MWCWTRLSSVRWEDSWRERLGFLGPERLVFVEWANGRTLKIEAYTDQKTATKLVREFGGKAAPVKTQVQFGSSTKAPLAIRGRLRVYRDADAFASRAPVPGKSDILIPPGMAFGTGDHATTATCLRMLCDAITPARPHPDVLDAGCGSGILAIAAAALGARHVDAFDFDPLAVRAARENIRANKVTSRVHATRTDIYEWSPSRTYAIVTANLFSNLLVDSAALLAAATESGGLAIISGILREQFEEVETALAAHGLHKNRVVYKGKWTAVCFLKT